ncbi:hypothetical protein [Cellulomonas cellasea]|uniref:hypothetical protein n=1 Tax=Cellulomonas cellasea TaxID=43670 RepID=UPI0011427158|nr:hypothetical protein [Cellulomonas cellasea]
MNLIFQASDLAGTKRREFLDAAREGRAHIRDTDGTDLVTLRAHELGVLDDLAYWSNQQRRLALLLGRAEIPSVVDLGDLAWLRVFDAEDMRAFVDELQNCLIAAFADNDSALIHEAVKAWRVTAQQAEDPLRRAVLTGRHDPSDFREGGESLLHQEDGS